MDIQFWLREAFQVAEGLSDDKETRNAAIILSADGDVLVKAANQLPRGLEKTDDRLVRPEKYDFLIHAEQNAIAEAARLGRSVAGATMICPWATCIDCAKLLIQSGIVRLITHKAMLDRTPERWRLSVDKGTSLLIEAGISCFAFDKTIGGVANRFNAEDWQP